MPASPVHALRREGVFLDLNEHRQRGPTGPGKQDWCWEVLEILMSASSRAQVFGPAFRRNARWSVATPVPEVGEEGTPWEAVDAFYDFWFGFRSWREFPHPDEEDTEQAECREEKRCAPVWGLL